MHRSLILLPLLPTVLAASEFDGLRVQREACFEFAQPPTATRDGDRVTIRFATKGRCDVTVAVENGEGRIIRHLACGLLGPNAPAPFRKDSLEQTLVWDGKDDFGRYVDDKDALRIRVSLGLKPRFERTLFWSPGRRLIRRAPCLVTRPEGVYYADGSMFDRVKLFDHDGRYLRTVYPFPSTKLDQVKGLSWHRYPQDGKRLPVKVNYTQSTLLQGGGNAWKAVTYGTRKQRYSSYGASGRGMGSSAASCMAGVGKRIALADLKLTRLGTDGSSGGLPLNGPETSIVSSFSAVHEFRGGPQQLVPRSAAFSPDGRHLYLTGYLFDYKHLRGGLNVVMRMDYEKGGKPEVFAGTVDRAKAGKGNGQFAVATSVACDPKGRVYVSDYLNDRIQVFASDGKHLKNIPTPKPVRVQVDGKRGEIWVASWNLAVHERQLSSGLTRAGIKVPKKLPARLRRLASLDDPKVLAEYELPLARYQVYHGGTGHEYEVHVDTHVEPTRVWVVPWGAPGARGEPLLASCVHLYETCKGKLKRIRILGETANKRFKTLEFRGRSRVYVNPATGKLYVQATTTYGIGGGHGAGGHKGFEKLVEVDPVKGKYKIVKLPMRPEDLVFGPDGLCYMRGMNYMARFDPRTWREVPWDYGEERIVGFFGNRAVVSAIPAHGVNWHMGGLGVNFRGDVVISTYVKTKASKRGKKNAHASSGGGGYVPRLYPGRRVGGKGPVLHVYDRHGQMLYEDALPGLGIIHGVEIDNDGNLYVGGTATKRFAGKPYFNDMTGTIIRTAPRKARLISAGKTPIGLSEGNRPKGPHDLNDKTWVQDAEWVFGGVGWCGKGRSAHGCDCLNTQFDLDFFRRTFVAEMDRYSVAVLDANGNVILRLGRYGNVDEGKPLIADGGPENARSIGGDELSLFHGAYLAVHTDHRLFIVDNGNNRIASVKLDYHTTRQMPLRGLVAGR